MTEADHDPSAAHILVVDDNEANRDVLGRRLARRGFKVTTAENGTEALDLVAHDSFDAILLDIMMPDLSGLDVLARIREDHSKPELPVLMATARTGSDDMVEAFRLGANDYVTKPIDFPVVLARLESHLAVRREVVANKAPDVVVAASENLPAGTLLDRRYRIEGTLGEGGFAVVYAAEQVSTGLPVAVKLLRADRIAWDTADVELARFELEMKVIARTDHPAIVRLVDSGVITARPTMRPVAWSEGPGLDGPSESDEIAGQSRTIVQKVTVEGRSVGESAPPKPRQKIPYIVMERLVGETLDAAIAREGRMAPTAAVDLILPLLDGVQSLHAQGVIHRDIKPSNIFLAADGTGGVAPKVLDFGIAKITNDDRPSLTRTSVLVGTPEYMSPEQANGQRLDGRSDQYTLAVVLSEMITGEKLYSGTAALEILHQIARGEVVSPQERRGSMADALDQVLMTALSIVPADRFDDLRAFGDALSVFASDDGRTRWERLTADGGRRTGGR